MTVFYFFEGQASMVLLRCRVTVLQQGGVPKVIHCYNKLSVTTVLKIDHSLSVSETKQSRTLSSTEYTFKCRNQRDNSGLGKTQ